MKVYKCYVCKKPVREDKAQYIGQGMYRHKRCYIGSTRWFKSELSQKSPLRKYFENISEEGGE
jgi:hypothetical protein